MKMNNYSKKKDGFTLVEMLFFMFIFVIATTAFYKILTTGVQLVLESKYRLGALALANEKMEIARSLQYDSVGTTTGIPDGNLLAQETVVAGKRTFHVNTFVQYVDDPFDGSYPVDTIFNDYKKVKITVSWNSFTGVEKEVFLLSRFVPPGMEGASGDGILSVNIMDSSGAGIPQANVHIVNNSTSPHIDINQQTSDNGNLIFPGAEQSEQKYEITASKSGYETVATIAPGSVTYLSIDIHASVVTGLLNIRSVVIDRVSDLKIKSVDQFGKAIPDIDFHLEGGRILGMDTTVVPADTIYILNSVATTGLNGEKYFTDHSPGQFFLTDIETVSGYTLAGVSPITEFAAIPLLYKFSILPDGSDKTVEIKFADNNENALLVKVLNNSDNSPMNGASVKLTSAVDYNTTVTTSFDGVAFFPQSATALEVGDYTLEVTLAGFQTNSGTVTVNKLTNAEVKMVAE